MYRWIEPEIKTRPFVWIVANAVQQIHQMPLFLSSCCAVVLAHSYESRINSILPIKLQLGSFAWLWSEVIGRDSCSMAWTLNSHLQGVTLFGSGRLAGRISKRILTARCLFYSLCALSFIVVAVVYHVPSLNICSK